MRKASARTLREWQRKRDRFRRKNPEWLSPAYRPIEAHLEPRPAMHQPAQVLLLWRGENGELERKTLPWSSRPATTEALSEWMQNYLTMVEEGYQPSGHQIPPRPHCARIVLNGRVLAEWMDKWGSGTIRSL
ncbi:MAG TPA: hypothetical protein VIY49_26705 [Bryobacteraceae bacterium]